MPDLFAVGTGRAPEPPAEPAPPQPRTPERAVAVMLALWEGRTSRPYGGLDRAKIARYAETQGAMVAPEVLAAMLALPRELRQALAAKLLEAP